MFCWNQWSEYSAKPQQLSPTTKIVHAILQFLTLYTQNSLVHTKLQTLTIYSEIRNSWLQVDYWGDSELKARVTCTLVILGKVTSWLYLDNQFQFHAEVNPSQLLEYYLIMCTSEGEAEQFPSGHFYMQPWEGCSRDRPSGWHWPCIWWRDQQYHCSPSHRQDGEQRPCWRALLHWGWHHAQAGTAWSRGRGERETLDEWTNV